MAFKRKIYDKLLEWKKTWNGSYAILIEGARHIGKSTIVEEFAKNEYEDYIFLDFNDVSEEIKSLFINNISNLDEFFRLLFLLISM